MVAKADLSDVRVDGTGIIDDYNNYDYYDI